MSPAVTYWRIIAAAARVVAAFDKAEGGSIPAPVSDELEALRETLEDVPVGRSRAVVVPIRANRAVE